MPDPHDRDDNKPRYKPDKKHPDPVVGMSDSSYAPSNEKNRRSVSGRCYFLFGSLISWYSKLQPLTAASTHEAELVAMASAADEGVWIRNLLLECGFIIPSISGFYKMPTSKDLPTDFRSYAPLLPFTPLYGDNQATMFSSNNPERLPGHATWKFGSSRWEIMCSMDAFVCSTFRPMATSRTSSPRLCTVWTSIVFAHC